MQPCLEGCFEQEFRTAPASVVYKAVPYQIVIDSKTSGAIKFPRV